MTTAAQDLKRYIDLAAQRQLEIERLRAALKLCRADIEMNDGRYE